MPDDELFELARKNELRKNLDAQLKRMLADSRSMALVKNFAAQWLQIRNLATVSPSLEEFPEFDEDLRKAMVTELLDEGKSKRPGITHRRLHLRQ